MKFSAAEMAYEPPKEIDFSKSFLIRGYDNFRRFREWKRRMARLDPDVRAAFPDDQAVNEALRKLVEIRNMMPSGPAPRRKKTA